VAGDSAYQVYAHRLAAAGDSAILAVERIVPDSTVTPALSNDELARLERHATTFAGILRPDTTSALHHQMLEGLDSLVVAMRVLHEREQHCGSGGGGGGGVGGAGEPQPGGVAERTAGCADARDYGLIVASVRRGRRIYLDARGRMDLLLRQFGVRLPPAPERTGR
jgi:hypothetical protein